MSGRRKTVDNCLGSHKRCGWQSKISNREARNVHIQVGGDGEVVNGFGVVGKHRWGQNVQG